MSGNVRRGPVVVAAVAGAAFAVLLIAANLAAAEVPEDPVAGGYVSLYRPADEPIDVVLNQGDGQAYAALAADPLLEHPEVFDEGAPAAAFFGQRALGNYLAWALSLGRPSASPYGLALSMVIATAVLASGAVALAQVRGAGDRSVLAGMVVLLPGSLAILDWFEPGMLGLGLTLWALVAWHVVPRRLLAASLAFAGAALCRESLVLVPAVLGVEMLMSRSLRWREATALLAAPLTYVGWQLVVRARLGTGPESVASDASLTTPLRGVVDAAGGWGAAEMVVLLGGIGLVVAALVRRPADLLTHLAVAFLVGSLVMHGDVWRSWEGFGRVLLPMYAFSALTLLEGHGTPSPLARERASGAARVGRGLPSTADGR